MFLFGSLHRIIGNIIRQSDDNLALVIVLKFICDNVVAIASDLVRVSMACFDLTQIPHDNERPSAGHDILFEAVTGVEMRGREGNILDAVFHYILRFEHQAERRRLCLAHALEEPAFRFACNARIDENQKFFRGSQDEIAIFCNVDAKNRHAQSRQVRLRVLSNLIVEANIAVLRRNCDIPGSGCRHAAKLGARSFRVRLALNDESFRPRIHAHQRIFIET
mmetsp:Transcript_11686/g.31475  ORF Transcript_11686/g.31475 Transcript_11686/m.31475 type:complete len:221 (+) Transcript_11686:215-877(+)